MNKEISLYGSTVYRATYISNESNHGYRKTWRAMRGVARGLTHLTVSERLL
jgi:hypothetical protein